VKEYEFKDRRTGIYDALREIIKGDLKPRETTRGLPGDPDDIHSRYIEAEVNGIIIGCLYLPNGNPAPGPKFDYKRRWFDRLALHAANLLAEKRSAPRRVSGCAIWWPRPKHSAPNRRKPFPIIHYGT
jgi:exonuclease III